MLSGSGKALEGVADNADPVFEGDDEDDELLLQACSMAGTKTFSDFKKILCQEIIRGKVQRERKSEKKSREKVCMVRYFYRLMG